MSRIEKWQAYRESITNSSLALQQLQNEIKVLEDYKKRIDKIHPDILKHAPLELTALKMVSINKTNNKEQTTIINTLNNINEEQINHIIQQIETINHVLDDNLLDEKGNIAQAWLDQDEGYQLCLSFRHQLKKIRESVEAFSQQASDKLTKIINTDISQKNYAPIKPMIYDEKKFQNKKTAGILIVSALIITIVIIILLMFYTWFSI